MKKLLNFINVILCAFFAIVLTSCGETTSFEKTPFKITKKGVSVARYNDGSRKSAWLLEDLGISWYYNWGSSNFADNINAEFVPMIWGTSSMNQETLNEIREGYEEGRYKYLLTFNEPDVYSPGISSGISVETALDLWPELEKLGIPLSSPAPTNYYTGWLDEFMEGVKERNYRVDFIALHCYQNFGDANAVNELRNQLIEIYQKYQLPIWITEFAAIDIWVWGGHTGNPDCTLDAAKKYTKNISNMLESLGFIERYAWFIDNTSSEKDPRASEAKYTYLYNDDDTLSETGIVYKEQKSNVPLEIVTELEKCKVNEKYEIVLNACGGSGRYTFSSDAPNGVNVWYDLPDGLSLSSSGVLSGTFKSAGTYNICISVKDDNQQMTFKYFKITVE